MKRSELEHILRAAGAITGSRTFVVVGSQAILASHPNAPAELLVSQEADLYSPENESAADLIDGSIGEGSPFQVAFGYYAHGVGPETAILPARWMDRSIRIENSETGGVVGICPHPSDLAISKLVAWREKAREFVAVLLAGSFIGTSWSPGWQSSIRKYVSSLPEDSKRSESRDANARTMVRPAGFEPATSSSGG